MVSAYTIWCVQPQGPLMSAGCCRSHPQRPSAQCLLAWVSPAPTVTVITGVRQVSPVLPKFALCHSALTKDLHQYLFSLPGKHPKRISRLQKQQQKMKTAFSVHFAVRVTEQHTPSSPAAPLNRVWGCRRPLSLYFVRRQQDVSPGPCCSALRCFGVRKVLQECSTLGEGGTPC